MSPVGPSPNPNIPSEYCSTIPPLQQARAAGTLNSPPPTVMVPVSVLKHPNDSRISWNYHNTPPLLHSAQFSCNVPKINISSGCPREQKRVWFADGILPNGEVADTSKLSVASRRDSQEFGSVSPDQAAVRPPSTPHQSHTHGYKVQKMNPPNPLIPARFGRVGGCWRGFLLSRRPAGCRGSPAAGVRTLGLRPAFWTWFFGEEGTQSAVK